MTEKLLIIAHMDDSLFYNFTDYGVEVFKPSDLGQTVDPADITIAFGWNQTAGNQLLNAPNSKLKWIHAISAGVDTLPLAEFAKRNIILTNSSGIHATSIAQSVLAFILHFVRNIDVAMANKPKQHWPAIDEVKPHSMTDFTYTIFGTGHIGQEIARLIKAFGAKTIGINSTGHPVDYFDETLALEHLDDHIWQSDVIINVMPLNDHTRQFYNQQFFNHFNNLFLFVNVGRGPSVNSNDLISALQAGQVQHAALDVFETEPLPANSPFWRMDNVLVTPHSTGQISHFQRIQVELLLKNLPGFVKSGTISQNQVNLDKGY